LLVTNRREYRLASNYFSYHLPFALLVFGMRILGNFCGILKDTIPLSFLDSNTPLLVPPILSTGWQVMRYVGKDVKYPYIVTLTAHNCPHCCCSCCWLI